MALPWMASRRLAAALGAVSLGLALLAPAPHAVADEPPFDLSDPARIDIGKLRYAQTCAGYCHGGGGVGGRAPDFLGRGEIDAGRFFQVIRNGRKRGSDIMPRWDATFTPEQTWELVAYLKHLAAQPRAAQ